MSRTSLSLLAGPLLVLACSAPSPVTPTLGPTSTPPPTLSARPSASPAPTATATPSPSPTPGGRVFSQADFGTSGGCGDVFIYAASTDGTLAVTINWESAASAAWQSGPFDQAAMLPMDGVQAWLEVGQHLSAGFCTDIGNNGSRVDGKAPAISGTVRLSVTADAGGFQPQSHADVDLHDVVFEVFAGTNIEHWRIDSLVLKDISVGWYPG